LTVAIAVTRAPALRLLGTASIEPTLRVAVRSAVSAIATNGSPAISGESTNPAVAKPFSSA
jgi:hypothetical protein